jgi:ABC-2 type transport system ATP-binding protein
MNPVIRLDRVVKRFGRQTALDEFSLEVPPGVVFALLGENGAGKTTALRIMLGLTKPDAGQSEVLGLDSQRRGLEIRRRIGYVPEQPTLYDWMTVGEIGWFTSGFYGDGFLPRYQQLTEGFDLTPSGRLKELSKGMRAKVSLALAMAHNPDLLVLDEPTSGLDALVRRQFLESMVDRAAAEQTVLLSSHQIGEVERVADMVAIIRRGRLVLVERLDDLKAQVKELTVTLPDHRTEPPQLEEGEILWERRRDRQWQLLVRNMGEEAVRGLERAETVRSIELRTPNLEEIFVALMTTHAESEEGEASVETGAVGEASEP